MTIILFLVDTSASMCQKAYVNGVQKTYLDIAKGAVETFLKYRQRTQDCLGDRYMLLTFEEPPANVKAGWKENHATFMNELKNLQSNGLTSMGESLRNAFDLLNLNRMQSGIDTYGQGRCPFYLEPSVIIVITDGGRYSYRNGVHQEIILPLSTQVPGTKFTKEPFRWDQRLFSLVLRMSGNKMDERVEGKVPHDDSPIERMCEVTGGRSYRVRSHYVLNQCIESLVQKVQAGVVLQFEPLPPKEQSGPVDQEIVFQPTKKMIYVQKHISQKTFLIGYWPLPEPYWPDPKAVTLPPRDAHPKLKIITSAVEEPQLVRSFPVDKYEVEASPLTLQILNKREMNKCWQVLVTNGMHGFELPFGYLKAAPNFTQVHLYVLAYNYPALLPLLHDLIHKYNMNPPNDLMYKFNAYVRSIPPYYCPFLRKALVNVNVPYQLLQFLLPDNVDNYLSPTVANQLKHIKNTAKQDQENLCLKVYKQLKQPKPPYRQVETAKLNTGALLRRDLVRNPLLRDTFTKLHAEIDPVENYTIVVPQLTRQASAKSYRNPFDIPRRDMVEEIARMREVFLRSTPASLVAKDSGHCLPIAEMGNYQEYLKNKDNPLREIEPTNVRQHMFGNPYKKDKHMVMVDEADLSDVAPMKAGNGGAGVPGAAVGGGVSSVLLGGPKKMEGSRSRKRKAGPLPRSFIYRRTSADQRPSSSASSSPSRSSYDEDSQSETSSICSDETSDDDDMNRIGFDFDDDPGEQELNGYVHNLINGINNDESSQDSESSSCSSGTSNASIPTPSVSAAIPASVIASSIMNATLAAAHHHEMSMATPVHYSAVNGMTHATYGGYAPHNSSPMDIIGGFSAALAASHNKSVICNGFFTQTSAISSSSHHAISAYNTTPLPSSLALSSTPSPLLSSPTPSLLTSSSTSLSSPPTTSSSSPSSSATSSSTTATPASASQASSHSPFYSHNDINDASEISRILQQCHTSNGSLTSSSVSTSPFSISSAINGNNNNNNNVGGGGSSSSSSSTNDGKTTDASLPTGQATSGALLSNSFDSLKRETSSSGGSGSGTSRNAATTNNHLPLGQSLHPHWGNNVQQQMNHNNVNSTNTGNSSNSLASNSLASNSLSSSNHVSHNNGNGNSTSNNNSNSSNTNSNHHNHPANHHHPQSNQTPSQLPNRPSDNVTNGAVGATVATEVPPLTDEQREAARRHNMDLRTLVFRDIRRPGRDYSQLLEHLNLIKGDNEMVADFIEMCINESMRFRRRQMSSSIQDWWARKQEEQQNETTSQQLSVTQQEQQAEELEQQPETIRS